MNHPHSPLPSFSALVWFYQNNIFSNKDGNETFSDWKLKSAVNCQRELSFKLFFAEEVLGYWVNCVKCKKWRKAKDDVVRNGVISSTWECSKVILALFLKCVQNFLLCLVFSRGKCNPVELGDTSTTFFLEVQISCWSEFKKNMKKYTNVSKKQIEKRHIVILAIKGTFSNILLGMILRIFMNFAHFACLSIPLSGGWCHPCLRVKKKW